MAKNCNHDEKYALSKPIFARHAIYGLLNVIGVAIAIFGLYSSVQQILGN